MDEIPIPPDNQVHTEFSWDADNGSMFGACEQAVKLGLPSVAFTEHIDFTPWLVPETVRDFFPPHLQPLIDHDGHFHAPELNVDGYFESIERCRAAFPGLRILTGLEIGEPHWFPEATTELLARGPFERVLGSLHSLTVAEQPRLIDEWFRTDAVAGEVEAEAVRNYLTETIAMVAGDDRFEVYAHIDYLVRQIEAAGRSHDPRAFEEEYRETLRSLAGAERILEINTRRELDPVIVQWWHEVGGGAVSFGSDAHEGAKVGGGFLEAAAMAEAAGFAPQPDPLDFWRR